MKAFDTREKILQEITAIDSQLDVSRVITPFEHILKHAEKAYQELTDIHQKQERYNVSWAFTYAAETLQQLITSAFTKQLKEKIAAYAGTFRNRKRKHVIEKRFAVIQRTLTEKINKTRTSPKVFRTAAALLLLAEMTGTALIVLILSRLAVLVDANITIPQLSVLFLIIFSLIRLFLYRAKTRFLHNWSWGMYQDAVDTAFDGIAIILAASFVLAFHVKKGVFLESKLDTVLTRSLRLLQEPPSKTLKRQRRARHKAARLKTFELEKIEHIRSKLEYQTIAETFTLDSPAASKRKQTITASTPMGTIQIRPPKRQFPAQGESPLPPELPSQESLLTPDAVTVMKKRTTRVMDYLSKKFSIQKSQTPKR